MARDNRIDLQPAWVLHSRPWRETSLMLDVLTRHHGRLSLVARGARRPRAEVRGVLLAFQPLILSWFGKGEVRTLHAAEWQGGLPQLSGQPLLCAFYVNELLMRLLHRDEAHEDIFDIYGQTIARLAHGLDSASTLRCFELDLLAGLGYGLNLSADRDGQLLQPDAAYLYRVEQGPLRVPGDEPGALRGQTLIDCARRQFSDAQTRQQARLLLRQVLQHYLGPEPLQSRLLLQDWA